MLVFVHIEKTAGTSIKYILRNNFGIHHCDSLKNKKEIFTQQDLDLAKKIFGNIRCITGHNIVEPTKHLNEDELKFITFLRDPIKRSASFYQDNCLRGERKVGFEEWMRDEKKHNMQTKRIAGEPDLEKAKALLRDKYHFVGLTERFDESLKLFSVTFPEIINLKYKKELIARDNSIKNELLGNQATLKILQESNRLDMALYDYVKNDLFPERLQKFEDQLDKVSLPETYSSNHYTFNNRISIAFNKFVYRQILKIRNTL